MISRTHKETFGLIEKTVGCPYCGERYGALIDVSSGSGHYIEDCYICCQPILFQIRCGHLGEFISADLYRDDD